MSRISAEIRKSSLAFLLHASRQHLSFDLELPMAGRRMPNARYYVDNRPVTIAVAVLVRIERQAPTQLDVEHWIKAIGTAMAPILGVEAGMPAGITIRVTEQDGKGIAKDLILDAAAECPAYFRRAAAETPTRAVAHRWSRIWTAVTLAWGLALFVKMFKRRREH
jgi:hypothetical protein